MRRKGGGSKIGNVFVKGGGARKAREVEAKMVQSL